MSKRIVTIFANDGINEVVLFKDVGGIPYALAKYCGWEATFVYNDTNGIIHNEEYERYVKLVPLSLKKNIKIIKSRYIRFFPIIKYIYKNVKKYDVINFYHSHEFTNFLCWLAKKINPKIITYVKLDMDEADFQYQKERDRHSLMVKTWSNTDVFTVETLNYVDELNKLKKYNKKVKYLPNGFFSDLVDIDLSNIKKEKIILTVGRLGTYQKNTELLIESLINIEEEIKDWEIYLVGPITNEFKVWLNEKLIDHQLLKEKIVITGNIVDKVELYKIYAKASVFVLCSRYESWGLVLTEALHFSDFVIVTDCCKAFHDILLTEKDKLGVIIENQNVEALSNAICDSIINIKKNMHIAQKGKIFVDNNLNWNVVVKNLENYFMIK